MRVTKTLYLKKKNSPVETVHMDNPQRSEAFFFFKDLRGDNNPPFKVLGAHGAI